MNKKYLYPILAALLTAVVALIFFAPDDFKGNVLQQHDIMQGLANGQEVQQFEQQTGHAARWTNSLFGGMPTFQISPTYTANGLMGWIFSLYTLWLPSPANLLFAMMLGFFIMCLCMKMKWQEALFGAIAWGFSSYFIIIIGAGHIWKFVTLAYIPPTIGGLALLYRGKYLSGSALTALFAALQLQSNHPQMTYYFCFLILFMIIAWGVILYREKRFRTWIIASACAIGAGALALAANSASLYNSYEYAKETVRGRSTDLTDPSAADATEAAGMDRAAITAWSYGQDETLSLLIPNVKGGATIKPVGGQNTLLSVGDTDEANAAYLSPGEMQVVSSFPQYFGNQPMTNGPVYVGAIVLLLAILGLFVIDSPRYAPMKWALFAGAVFSMFLSWGHNFDWLTNLFIDYMPGYNKFRAVASILVVMEFCIPLLATMCVIKMVRTPDFLERYKWQFFTVFGLGAAICFIGWVAPSTFGQPFSASEISELQAQGIFTDPAYANVLQTIRAGRLGLVSSDSLRSLAYIIIGFLLIWLYLKRAFKNASLFVCGLTAVMLIDLFSVNKRYVNSDNFVEPTEQSGFVMTDADRAILQDTTYYRVADLQDFGGARSSYFHKTIGGYHAAKLTRYNDLLTRQIQPAVSRLMTTARDNAARLQALEQDSTLTQADIDSIDTRLFVGSDVPVLDMLNTKYYLYGDYAEENPNALGNAWFVDNIRYVDSANEVMDALSSLNPGKEAVAAVNFKEILGATSGNPEGSIKLTSYAPDRLTYSSDSRREGIAVFSEIFFPWGWTATIDGTPTPIARVDYTLRALKVPAGKHEIVFEFNPKSLSITNTIGVIAVCLIFTLCIFAIVAWGLRLKKNASNDA